MLMGGLGRFPWKQTNIRGVHSLNKVGEDYQGKAGASSKAHTSTYFLLRLYFIFFLEGEGGGVVLRLRMRKISLSRGRQPK